MKRIAGLFVFLIALASALVAADLEVMVTDSSGKPVADAVAYALPLDGQILPEVSATPAELEQINKEFRPHVTVVQTGGTVIFPNRDSIAHHVYSFSEAKKFELPLYSGVPAPIKFEKAGVVTLGCNIHDWMKAYIMVVDTPFFAVSKADGRIELKNLPEGKWRVEFWHPRQKDALPPREVSLNGAQKQSEKAVFTLRREWKKKKSSGTDGPGY